MGGFEIEFNWGTHVTPFSPPNGHIHLCPAFKSVGGTPYGDKVRVIDERDETVLDEYELEEVPDGVKIRMFLSTFAGSTGGPGSNTRMKNNAIVNKMGTVDASFRAEALRNGEVYASLSQKVHTSDSYTAGSKPGDPVVVFSTDSAAPGDAVGVRLEGLTNIGDTCAPVALVYKNLINPGEQTDPGFFGIVAPANGEPVMLGSSQLTTLMGRYHINVAVDLYAFNNNTSKWIYVDTKQLEPKITCKNPYDCSQDYENCLLTPEWTCYNESGCTNNPSFECSPYIVRVLNAVRFPFLHSNAPYDFNNDGKIDYNDYAIAILYSWSHYYPPSTVKLVKECNPNATQITTNIKEWVSATQEIEVTQGEEFTVAIEGSSDGGLYYMGVGYNKFAPGYTWTQFYVGPLQPISLVPGDFRISLSNTVNEETPTGLKDLMIVAYSTPRPEKETLLDRVINKDGINVV